MLSSVFVAPMDHLIHSHLSNLQLGIGTPEAASTLNQEHNMQSGGWRKKETLVYRYFGFSPGQNLTDLVLTQGEGSQRILGSCRAPRRRRTS